MAKIFKRSSAIWPALLPTLLIAAAPLPALAASAKAPPAASIPFANHGGVWDWRADGDRTVYFEDNHKQWYKADLMGFSSDLPFVEFIGLDTSPSGSLDKWSAVYIHGQRYPFSSFVKVDGPPAKHAKKK